MKRTPAARRGYAVILALFFVLLFTAMLGVLVRCAATTLRIESDRAARSRYDQGTVPAMARALALLETGLPPQDPYVCCVTIDTPGGPRSFAVTFTGDDGGAWRVHSEPAVTGATAEPDARDLRHPAVIAEEKVDGSDSRPDATESPGPPKHRGRRRSARTAGPPGGADEPLGALPRAGRRMRARRAEERRGEYFVDRFPSLTLALIVAVALASLADGVLTLHLLENGCDEVNPVMDLLLERGAAPFLVGKYLLTVLGLPLLLIYKNFYLFGTRLRVGHLLPIAVAAYFVLLLYQCRLLALAVW